ncbi:zinc finger MYM-type protein 1 [Artemisia annua]|uniref:Zinc finger MYM-type protein 1 n=1 Tax=Artemisia annua TaxID=35608 RepID=A0A2U1KRX5_ARTAN|nr:zinc finger MYM-type protein 1 [Artemisia annua]
MKIFKNRLRNKMSDENLANSMVIYIEKETADKFDSESIIEEFKGLKEADQTHLDP